MKAVTTTALDPLDASTTGTVSIRRKTYAVSQAGCVSAAIWADKHSWQCDASTDEPCVCDTSAVINTASDTHSRTHTANISSLPNLILVFKQVNMSTTSMMRQFQAPVKRGDPC